MSQSRPYFKKRQPKRPSKRSPARKEHKLPRNTAPVELEIQHIGSSGDGVGEASLTLNYQTKNYRIFVPHTLPGEHVIAQPVSLNSQGIKATLTELVTPSADRQTPPCSLAFECGGCQLQHLSTDAYRTHKQAILNQALQRENITPEEIHPPFWADQMSRRRTRIAFKSTASDLIIGFFARQTHHIIAIDSCLILEPELKALIPQLKDWLTPVVQAGQQGHIQINMLDEGADILLASEQGWTEKQLASLASTASALQAARISVSDISASAGAPSAPILLYQDKTPHLSSLGLGITPPAGGFLQSVSAAELEMQKQILTALEDASQILDLFCGCGSLSAPLVRQQKSVWASDSDEASCKAYRAAADAAGLGQRLKISTRNLFEAPLRAAEMKGYDAAIIDPPRAGASSQMPHLILSDIQHIVMVSCNPFTLARDVSQLVTGGFTLKSVRLIDQFLWSTHCEAIAILTRNRSASAESE